MGSICCFVVSSLVFVPSEENHLVEEMGRYLVFITGLWSDGLTDLAPAFKLSNGPRLVTIEEETTPWALECEFF
jgi:hypothetical protein